jgi:plastocyanin
MNETLFYAFGIALAISAVLFSFLGLKAKNFPGKAFPLVLVWFVVLAGGAASFAVLHAQDEEEHKAKEFEQAGEEIEAEEGAQFEEIEPGEGPEEEAAPAGEGEEDQPAPEEAGEVGPESEKGMKESEGQGKPEASAEGAGGEVKLSADESALLYDTDSLESAAGKIKVDFDNPSSIPHNVAIEDEAGEQLLETEIVAQKEESGEVDLKPGTYTFYCSVPGHREAGMEGTLTVK